MITYVKNLNKLQKKIDDLYEVYPLLKVIDENNNGIVARSAMFRTLESNQYLANDGERCPGFIFIIKGNIKIQRVNDTGKETNLYNLGKGQLCNEISNCFKGNDNLNICARAIQDSELCIVPCAIAKRYVKEDKEFLRFMYNDLYRKHQLVIKNKEAIKHEPLETRLIKLLISKNTKNIYATHNELAFEIDSTREVISRRLKSFEKRGYIKMLRGKIQILKDLEELLD